MDLSGNEIKMKCKWYENIYDGDIYSESDCGKIFQFSDNGFELDFKFCPYCGKEIEVIKYQEK